MFKLFKQIEMVHDGKNSEIDIDPEHFCCIFQELDPFLGTSDKNFVFWNFLFPEFQGQNF